MTDCHPESRACMRYIFNTHGVTGAFANSDFDAARSIGKIDSPGPKESKHKTNRTGFHLRSEQKCACTNTSTIQSRKRQQPTRCCCANDSAVHRSSPSIRYTGLGRWCQKHCTPKLRLVPPLDRKDRFPRVQQNRPCNLASQKRRQPERYYHCV
jgi:hypothetical protein